MFADLVQQLGRLSMITLVFSAPAVTAPLRAAETANHLRLDGEVVQAEVERERQNRIYHLKVKLRFTNTGEKPVILLLGAYGEKRDWWVLDTTVSHSLRDALDGKPFYIRPTSPANSQSLPPWQEMRQQLSASRPPPTLTQTIQPNETFFREVETVVVISVSDAVSPGSRVWLKVFLELWPSNIEPWKRVEGSRPYGEKLKRRWQASGDLRLAPILSSPIPFDIPATSLP